MPIRDEGIVVMEQIEGGWAQPESKVYTTWERSRSLFPKVCKYSGAKIGMLQEAFTRKIEYFEYHDKIDEEVEYMSAAEYTFRKLQGTM